jgi:hypothetical protein
LVGRVDLRKLLVDAAQVLVAVPEVIVGSGTGPIYDLERDEIRLCRICDQRQGAVEGVCPGLSGVVLALIGIRGSVLVL